MRASPEASSRLLRAIPATLLLAALAGVSPSTGAQAPARDGKHVVSTYGPSAIAWRSKAPHRVASLRVLGPQGFVHEREFGPMNPVFDLKSLPDAKDGQYKFEVVFGLQPDAATMKSLSGTELREDGSVGSQDLRQKMRALRKSHSGAFRVEGGRILSPGLSESRAQARGGKSLRDGGFGRPKVVLTGSDGVIRNSLCVGFDCPDAPAFDDSTIVLMENNTRIKFGDTSNAPFANNDWEIEANSNLSGGANYLGFNDCGTADNDGGCSADLVFIVEAGARPNALYVESDGDVGLGTANPVLDLHMVTGNTPAIRLEQDGTSGFTPQTWDVAGNEANFFIRDVNGGSALPFRIQPGSPSNSIMIGGSSGSVGIGTSAPDSNSRLHVANGVLNLDDDKAVAWGGGSARPAILGNKPGQFFAMYTAGVERLRVDTSVISFLDATPLAWGTGAARPAIVGNKASNLLTMHIAGAERLRADTSGIKITGTLHLNGNPLPDYVFAPGFKLATIEENAAYMWKNRHLPAVGAAKTTADGQGVMDVYSQTRGMLEELEKAHIYIEQLHKEIKSLRDEGRQRDSDFRKELSELRALIAR